MMCKHIVQHCLGDEWKCVKNGSFDFIENVLPVIVQKAICGFTKHFVPVEQVSELCDHSVKWDFNEYFVIDSDAIKIHYLVILKVIRRSSVYKCVLVPFCFVLPVNLTWSSGFSRVKVQLPWPWIGSIRIWPLIVYGPSNMNCGPFSFIS